MSFVKTLFAAVLCCAATNATAQVATYDCKVASLEGRGFITERLIFSVDPSRDAAAVIDGIVNTVYKKPVAANLTVLSNGHYRINWEVRNLKSGAESFNIDYRLQFRPNENAFSIRATLRGFANRPFGTGTCQAVQGQSLLN